MHACARACVCFLTEHCHGNQPVVMSQREPQREWQHPHYLWLPAQSPLPLLRTPSPPDSGRRGFVPNHDEDLLATQAEALGTGSLTPRGQLGSRPHTPVGRVDIRPHDDLLGVPHTLYYTPASPKLEFKSSPTTPVTERWPNKVSKGRVGDEAQVELWGLLVLSTAAMFLRFFRF